jgi:hypothetical protein
MIQSLCAGVIFLKTGFPVGTSAEGMLLRTMP